MNTRLTTYLTVFALAITSVPARADVSPEMEQELIAGEVSPSPSLSTTAPLADAIESDTADEDYSAPQGKEVGKTDDVSQKARKKQLWQNIALAVTAVVVAVVALIVVSNNNGHHSNN